MAAVVGASFSSHVHSVDLGSSPALGTGAVWCAPVPGVYSTSLTSSGVVLEEGPQAARQGRLGAARGVPVADASSVGGRATGRAQPDLCGRSSHSPGCRPWLCLGGARHAVLCPYNLPGLAEGQL